MKRPLRIAVNALFLRPGRVGGSEIALRGLLEGLSELDLGDRIRVFTCADPQPATGWPAGVTPERCPVPSRPRWRRILWEQVALPGRIRRAGADVLWNAGFTAPVAPGVPQVTTVFDVQHLDHPEHFFPSHRLAWRLLVAAGLKRSRRIVVPSRFTAERLGVRAGVPAERLAVVPLGVERAFVDAVEAASDAERVAALGLDEGFLLCPATTHPHKGHAVLAEALGEARSRGILGARSIVLTGIRGFAHERILEGFRRAGVGDRLVVLGWIERRDLRALYRSASAVVVPTTYEGFGLPVLEGLAAGVPVVASDLAVLREQGGDAVRWVPPGDAVGLADALAEVLAGGDGGVPDGVEAGWTASAARLREILADAASLR